jgi:hypothetical protein
MSCPSCWLACCCAVACTSRYRLAAHRIPNRARCILQHCLPARALRETGSPRRQASKARDSPREPFFFGYSRGVLWVAPGLFWRESGHPARARGEVPPSGPCEPLSGCASCIAAPPAGLTDDPAPRRGRGDCAPAGSSRGDSLLDPLCWLRSASIRMARGWCSCSLDRAMCSGRGSEVQFRVTKPIEMSRGERPSSPVVCDIADFVHAAVSLGLDVVVPLCP